MLDQFGVSDDVEIEELQTVRSKQEPNDETHERCRQGEPSEERSTERHIDQEDARDENDQGNGHRARSRSGIRPPADLSAKA